MRRLRWLRGLLALAALIPATEGCEGPRDPGAGATRILEGEDPGIELTPGEWWLGDAVFYKLAASYGNAGTRVDLWLARLDGSAPEAIEVGAGNWWILDQSGGGARWVATAKEQAVSGPNTVTLHPIAGGSAVTLERTIGRPQQNGRCEVVMADAEGRGRLWRGPTCDALQPVAPHLDVAAIASFDETSSVVLAAPDDSAGFGLQEVALDGSSSELVPAVLGDHDDVPGFPPSGSLPSTRLAGAFFRRSCAEGTCFLTYERELESGTSRPFVMRMDTRREVALPGDAPHGLRSAVALDGRFVFWSDMHSSPAVPYGSLLVTYWSWEPLTGRVKSCDVPTARSIGASPSSTAGLMVFQGGQLERDGITLDPLDDERCIRLEKPVLWSEVQTYGWYYGGPRLSPSGVRLSYLSARTELWLADRDGGNPRRLLANRWFGQQEFVSEDELLVQFTTFEDGEALALVNVAGAEPIEQPIADRVFGRWRRIGRTVVLGAAFDPEKQTGELWLYDLDRRGHWLLDRDVSAFTAADGAVAYWVKGTKDRDGLWVRRLP